jgi:sugar phosphate isomerase/epimerase
MDRRRSAALPRRGQEECVFVACSTLCFARMPLERALRQILEFEFNKIDLAVHESGPHLRPSEVSENLESALHQVRHGPGLALAAIDIRFAPDLDGETFGRQFAAMCRFAKALSVSVLCIPAAPRESPLEAEIARLGRLVEAASVDGLVLTVETHSETLTSCPNDAVKLCQAVPGLALTLDPSHYIHGPHQGEPFDEVFPYVQNVRFRDTGRRPGAFQVKVGQGEIEYGRVVAMLERCGYDRALTVAILDRPENAFDIELEVRKLKLLLESLL